MASETEKRQPKIEIERFESGTNKDDVPTADDHSPLSCVRVDTQRKAPPSDTKYDGGNRKKLVVLTGAYYGAFVALGFPFAFGALYNDILDTFNSTRGETSLVPAFCIGCTFGIGFLSGIFIKIFGMKTVMTAGGLVSSLGLFTSWFAQSVAHLIVTAGVMNGIGNSFIFISTTTLVAGTFNKPRTRSIALAGIMFSGGVGTVVFPYIITGLKSVYGLRGTLLLISCFYLQTILSTLVITSSVGNQQFFKSQPIKDHVTGKDSKSNWRQMLRPIFKSFVITSCLSFGAANNISGILSDLTKSRGFSEESGLALILYFNSFNTMARLLGGILKLIPGLHSVIIFTLSAALHGLALIILGATSDWVVSAVLISAAGAGMGGMISMLPVVPLEVLSQEMLPFGLGFCGMMNGAVTPVVGAVMGLMFDNMGSYEVPFYVFGSIAIGAAALTIVVFTSVECRSKKQCLNSMIRL
ncbi:monocarboxylate transporter 3-like isoform X2 [Haliotis rubra]|uniref:monocarboxylate transporter 3-like isoform X2 n=1 Tax=Haliotis rubra TaxID=36100 RepID=UPI001EE60BBD|nr:monocarboxylate transporter 3-like isoform X2 [Haliotis rubra]